MNWLKLILPSLIDKEQVSIVPGRCSFDNIISVQEVVYSLEHDINGSFRMLIKIDVEKAYDTLSWSAILTVLIEMKFSTTWISWISICLTSTSFSLLINGTPSPGLPLVGASTREILYRLTFSF